MQGLYSRVSLVTKHNNKWLLMLFSAQVGLHSAFALTYPFGVKSYVDLSTCVLDVVLIDAV